MKQAGAAMAQIHGGMSIDKVDETMYVSCGRYLGGYICAYDPGLLTTDCRDKLREQHQLSEEIGQAITSVPLGEQPDEEELDAELEGLEQEAMDERMLNTGPVPVTSQLDRLPAAGTSDRKSSPMPTPRVRCRLRLVLTFPSKQGQDKAGRGRRRGGRAGQAARRNGHVGLGGGCLSFTSTPV